MHDNPFYVYSHMLAHETLRRHERMVPHIRVLVRHELDESRLAIEVGDGSGEDVNGVGKDNGISSDCVRTARRALTASPCPRRT
jgi:hypothetical protein